MPIQYGNKESLQYGASDAARSKERREVLEGRLLRITQDYGLLINATLDLLDAMIASPLPAQYQ